MAVPQCHTPQALSLKCAADRDSLKLELAAAQLNVVAGRAPTTGADQVGGLPGSRLV